MHSVGVSEGLQKSALTLRYLGRLAGNAKSDQQHLIPYLSIHPIPTQNKNPPFLLF